MKHGEDTPGVVCGNSRHGWVGYATGAVMIVAPSPVTQDLN
jgi:hypothetical protein